MRRPWTQRWLGALVIALAAPGSTSADVEIRIQPARSDGHWRAVYQFPEPVTGLVFLRQSGYRRVATWRVETPGYALSSDEHGEGVRLLAGAYPRQRITLAFPVDTTVLEKDYQLFQPFSDGSLLLYTGHLGARPWGLDGRVPAPPQRFVLAPRPGEHLVVEGRRLPGPTTWTDPHGEGTFVYFGAIEPLATEHVTAVLDPALPPWMVDRLHRELPRLFADYTELTGFALATRPTVLVSFRTATDPHSTTWKGGTLPDLIQMHIEAAPDAPEDPDLLRRFYKFLAHEAAHLWNGQLFHAPDRGQSWMHEGGADAFAWRAMHRAGLLDDAALEERQLGDLNSCLAGLGARPLAAVEEAGEFRFVYSCGSMLAWLSEAALQSVDPAADLHTLWATLFRGAAERGSDYDEELYLATLHHLDADPSIVAFIDDLLHRPMPDRIARVVDAFRRAGVELREAGTAMPASQREEWGRRALLLLMTHDCDGQFSFTRVTAGYRVHGHSGCRTLTAEVTVDRLGGHALVEAGDAAYDALAARCANGAEMVLRGPEGEEILVPCDEQVPLRTQWLGLASPGN